MNQNLLIFHSRKCRLFLLCMQVSVQKGHHMGIVTCVTVVFTRLFSLSVPHVNALPACTCTEAKDYKAYI